MGLNAVPLRGSGGGWPKGELQNVGQTHGHMDLNYWMISHRGTQYLTTTPYKTTIRSSACAAKLQVGYLTVQYSTGTIQY